MSTERINYLLQAWSSRQATTAEENELFHWITIDGNEELVKTHIANLVSEHQHEALFTDVNWENIYQAILQKTKMEKPQARVYKIYSLRRIAVAASIIGVLFVAGYLIVSQQSKERHPELVSGPSTHDVPAPDKNRAQIKLADGTIVYLDSAANGQLANMNGVIVTKSADGKIIYSDAMVRVPTDHLVYNTLTNPRGSQVMDMTLSDGSRVWLNAGSSITYPVAFVTNERRVSITGEAYFEIAKHDLPPALAGGKKGIKMPFIVTKGNMSVEVLGTHFNVNAYDDETEIKVTLLEGSVKVSNSSSPEGEAGVRLKPGQQAVLTTDYRLTTNNSPDIDQVLAWRNGYFNFNQESITTIMRELGRWYNTEIIFSGEKPDDKFSAIIKRSNNISQVFKMLEQTNRVHFKIEGLPDGKAGNKITVTR